MPHFNSFESSAGSPSRPRQMKQHLSELSKRSRLQRELSSGRSSQSPNHATERLKPSKLELDRLLALEPPNEPLRVGGDQTPNHFFKQTAFDGPLKSNVRPDSMHVSQEIASSLVSGNNDTDV